MQKFLAGMQSPLRGPSIGMHFFAKRMHFFLVRKYIAKFGMVIRVQTKGVNKTGNNEHLINTDFYFFPVEEGFSNSRRKFSTFMSKEVGSYEQEREKPKSIFLFNYLHSKVLLFFAAGQYWSFKLDKNDDDTSNGKGKHREE